jgi:hypothetical protein
MGVDPPPVRDCWHLRWRISFEGTKTVFHVSHGNGRRCALRFAGRSRSDTRRGRHRTLGPGDFVLDSHRIRSPRDTPLLWLPNPLLLRPLLPRAVGRPHRHRKPQRLPPHNLHLEQRGSGGARPRCILRRRSHLWKTATNRASETIVRVSWALGQRTESAQRNRPSLPGRVIETEYRSYIRKVLVNQPRWGSQPSRTILILASKASRLLLSSLV